MFMLKWKIMSNFSKFFCQNVIFINFLFFNRFYLFILREGGREEEREREKNISMWLPLTHPLLGTWPATHACALTGN